MFLYFVWGPLPEVPLLWLRWESQAMQPSVVDVNIEPYLTERGQFCWGMTTVSASAIAVLRCVGCSTPHRERLEQLSSITTNTAAALSTPENILGKAAMGPT